MFDSLRADLRRYVRGRKDYTTIAYITQLPPIILLYEGHQYDRLSSWYLVFQPWT